jgi:hypothetical protein
MQMILNVHLYQYQYFDLHRQDLDVCLCSNAEKDSFYYATQNNFLFISYR